MELVCADCLRDELACNCHVMRAGVRDDAVRNPSRYELFPGIEAIQVIARTFTEAEFRGFCLGNTLKYRLRAGKKDDPTQELDKANFYVELFERHKGECRAE